MSETDVSETRLGWDRGRRLSEPDVPTCEAHRAKAGMRAAVVSPGQPRRPWTPGSGVATAVQGAWHAAREEHRH